MDLKVRHSLNELWASSPLASLNAAYIEQMYDDYLQNPDSVSEKWRTLFDQLPRINADTEEVSHTGIKDIFKSLGKSAGKHQTKQSVASIDSMAHDARQVHVLQLINAYRFLGHLKADTDPLEQNTVGEVKELSLANHQLSSADLDTVFNTGSLVGPDTASLREIHEILQSTYCRSIGAEYMHLTCTEEKRWIQNYLESIRGKPDFSNETRMDLLHQLIAGEHFEKYLHTRYVGQKRFSLEGGESLLSMLREIIHRSGSRHQIKEIDIGMAHRGRLNVLVNIMGKTSADLFMEFEGKKENSHNRTGDVKYHMGFSSNLKTAGGPVHVAMAFNPSHLEIVAPVVEGSVRARQDHRKDHAGKEVLPVLIHGDAAFAGQGVVMETFNMSQSRGYSTKGTVHIVINNQIGFTSSNQEDTRSTLYCTDVAKMVSAPIFHVNGDDPEAVLYVTQLALDYRMAFSRDVVIDMICYRQHGHSEADEPMATQPMMYTRIRNKPTVLDKYFQHCLKLNLITEEEYQEKIKNYLAALHVGKHVVYEFIPDNHEHSPFIEAWHKYNNHDYDPMAVTAISEETFKKLGHELLALPENFPVHRSVKKILDARLRMAVGEIPVDWGFAENMAYISLMREGYNVRLSGQDSARGTFFHRHATLLNQENGDTYVPLRNLENCDSNFLVINSLLSEEAVLAFEYGYAITDPDTLTIWEAQFGDFANNAQVVIDQFISAGEQKWNQHCGLVMFLPHGLEGQGPEHSSARLERYLQLCAQNNMQVCIPTAASQIFHLLRRQMLMQCRVPLIIMTPKSLLRHPDASSPLEKFTDGQFNTVIGETVLKDDDKIKRIILCSGKVYYDLFDKRQEEGLEDIAIIRIEQLYPFPAKELKEQIARYKNADTFVWCQEEPRNQGAWFSSQHHMRSAIGKKYYLSYAGRPSLAAPAVGTMSMHKQQQTLLVDKALGLIQKTVKQNG
ncbi:MAG: 2-oxoglutarate dehydrogenase E1 component [Gammaproteobacteria bacterium]|nr:2-oxoglutarate dehydrogenase E1 component [Gammaproteobacteria bacterium]